MRTFVLVFLLFLHGLGLVSRAEAASGEAQIGVDVGMGTESIDGDLMLSGNVSGWLGVNEWIWLATAVGGNRGINEDSTNLQMLLGSAIAFDALAYMPWIQVLLGASLQFPQDEIRPVARVEMGVDRWLSFQWAIGAWVRGQAEWPPSPARYQLSGGIRCTWRWEP